MNEHEYETDDLLGGTAKATVWVQYTTENQIRYNPDGGGFESSIIEVEVWDAKVTSYSTPGCDLDRAGIEKLGGDGSWAKLADGLLLDHLNDAMVDDTFEYHELVEQVL